MKTLDMRDLQQNLEAAVDAAQESLVVVTRHGKPAAVILGVVGKDWETLLLEHDPELWSMIRERRSGGTDSRLEDVRARLENLD